MGKHGPTPLYDIRIDLQRQSLALRESDGDNWQKVASKIEKIGRTLEKAIPGLPTDRTPDDQMTKLLDGVIGCVEADRYAQMKLWEENDKREGDRKREWVSSGSGLLTCVGVVGDSQIWLSLLTAVVGGHKILFYYASSTVVDHNMVRSWLECRLPKTAFDGDRLNNTDAMNFHNVFPHEAGA